MMSVKLLRDVPNLGRTGQVVNVQPAYARNFLLPKKLAVIATPTVLAAAAKETADAAAVKVKTAAALAALADRVGTTTVTLTAKANPQGTLFAAVKASQVLAAIAAQLGMRLPPTTTVTPDQIKTVGDHTVTIELDHHKISSQIHIDHA